jgi:hypothetical protein
MKMRSTAHGIGGAAAYTSGPASPVGGESLFFGTASQNVLTIEFGKYDSDSQTFAAVVRQFRIRARKKSCRMKM